MSKTSVTLPEKLDISAVGNLRTRLEKALEKDAATIELNASNVDVLDSAAIQLLLSFQKQVNSEAKELRLIKASESMINGSALLGASDLLPVND